MNVLRMLVCFGLAALSAVQEVQCGEPPAKRPVTLYSAAMPHPETEEIVDTAEIEEKKIAIIFFGNDMSIPSPWPEDWSAMDNLRSLREKLGTCTQSEQLSDAEKERIGKVAKGIFEDERAHQLAIHEELEELISNASRPNAPFEFGLAAFTNAGLLGNGSKTNYWRLEGLPMVRRVHWVYCRPGEPPALKPWEIPDFDDFRYVNQPLSHPAVFERALNEEVRAIFPEDEYRYIFIIKSRGTAEKILAPSLTADMRTVPDEVLWEAALRVTAEPEAGARPRLSGTDGASGNIVDRFNEALLHVCASTDGDAPDLGDGLGVTKRNLLETLFYLGGRDTKCGMYFSIVLLQSYKSDLVFSRDPFLRAHVMRDGYGNVVYAGLRLPSVGAFFTMSDRPQPADYEVAHYQEVFRSLEYRAFHPLGFDEALAKHLLSMAAPGESLQKGHDSEPDAPEPDGGVTEEGAAQERAEPVAEPTPAPAKPPGIETPSPVEPTPPGPEAAPDATKASGGSRQ